MSIGENIRTRREALGLSQAEVARRAYITHSMLNQVEHGIKNPSMLVGKEIAKVLQCTVDDLLSGAER